MTRKTAFFVGWPWFKFNNLGLALEMVLKFYTSVEKGLKLKATKFCWLIPTFVEVTREKLLGRAFCIYTYFTVAASHSELKLTQAFTVMHEKFSP